jgi:hypothetical protein
MKTAALYITLLFLLSTLSLCAQDTISTRGAYQGKNLFLQQYSSVESDVIAVIVNDKKLEGHYLRTFKGSGKGIEVRLDSLGLTMNEQVEVKIIYNGMRPKLLNADALVLRSTFRIVSIKMAGDTLRWSTEGEHGALPFAVEQFKWNKWVKVGEVMVEGTPGTHNYEFKIELLRGKNQFRVRQRDDGDMRPSMPVSVKAKVPEVSFTPKKKVGNLITFSSVTSYELYDILGNVVMRGRTDHIDCSSLPKGKYYLNYGSKMGSFTKK